jgi:hypothetical protein
MRRCRHIAACQAVADLTTSLPLAPPLQVDGSPGAWTYILSDLYPLHDAPALTLGSAHMLLPVVHKYNFTKLLTRLIAFIEVNSEEALSPDPTSRFSYAITWLALAERLQLDELREMCIDMLRGMTRQQLELAITEEEEEEEDEEEEEEVGTGSCKQKKRVARKQIMALGPELLGKLLAIATSSGVMYESVMLLAD